MQPLQKLAYELNTKYGWNIVPLYYMTRQKDGSKQVKTIEWKKYKSELYPLDQWSTDYKALSIITGHISNLTILDIDSRDALQTILDEVGMELEELADYIVMTTKGYQLFYEYEPNLRTRIGIKDKVDFLNGGVTFAVSCNEGYSVIKSNPPSKMPQCLKDLIVDSEYDYTPTGMENFEAALRRNSDIKYKLPLNDLVQDFIDAKRISDPLYKKPLRFFSS